MRLIDADALPYSRIRIYHGRLMNGEPLVGGNTAVVLSVAIEDAPTIDAAPVVHARWNRAYEDWRHQMAGNECSACGFVLFGPVGSYCPRCGAKMDGGADNE